MELLNSRPSLLRSLFTLLISALVLVACGSDDGGDSDPGGTTVAPSAEPEPSGQESSGGGDQGNETAPDSPSNISAVVTIGSDIYEFGGSQYDHCLMTEEGIFKATVLGEGGLAVGGFSSLAVNLPPDGLDPADLPMPWDAYPHVSVVIGDSNLWEANAYESTPESINNRHIPEGMTQVDSFQFDASGASGTATFLDMANLTQEPGSSSFSGDPLTGTFELSCG